MFLRITGALFLAALLSALVAGCGGGTEAQALRVTIDAEGDSTMFGLETAGGQFVQASNPPPAQVQASLRALFGAGVTVNGHGVPGANLYTVLQGTGSYGAPLQARLALSRAQIVLENFGINDAFLPPEAYRANLRQFVDTVRAAGKLPVLEEPNPVCAGHDKLDELIAILREVAGEKAVPLVPQYEAIRALPDWQAMLPDCIHPGDALYAFKAAREAAALAQVIRNLP